MLNTVKHGSALFVDQAVPGPQGGAVAPAGQGERETNIHSAWSTLDTAQVLAAATNQN